MNLLLKGYKVGYDQIQAEINGLTEQQLAFKPSEKAWSIKEILIHITDAELVHIHRMKAVISEENPLLTAFDQDRWSKNLNYLVIMNEARPHVTIP